MDVTTEEQNNIDHATDSYPLLVEARENHGNEHVIDLETVGDDDTSSSNGSNNSLNGLARSPRDSASQLVRAPSSGSSSLGRRGDGLGRRRWSPFDTLLWISIELGFTLEEENRPATSPDTWNGLNVGSNARLTMLVDHFKMALDCFSAVWFVVGNVWIFGGHSTSAEAPNLYRLCIVFLTFSCIGYAMPFILCGMICCCLPCIISILGVHEDMNQMKGASDDSINALPTHKFKSKKNGNFETKDNNDLVVDEGGILAAGTDKERAISGEDAVCCICLAKYADNDLLRELPCTHFFHIECVDKWLKINASCPLCKFEIKGSNDISSTQDSIQQQA
ncbi:putative transcription factor C2H2 family [Helianthus annuus]|nr:putative transcription factor C2H2 family [Helianthus annuus]